MGKFLIILRGVSGAGKSTYAKRLQQKIWWFVGHFGDRTIPWMNQTAIASADNYFIRPDGVYDFNFKTIKNAHQWCRDEVKRYMVIGVYAIIIDNTNTQKWEYEHYIKLAEQNGYKVKIKTIGKLDEESLKIYAGRNQHGVPPEAIDRMAKRFET